MRPALTPPSGDPPRPKHCFPPPPSQPARAAPTARGYGQTTLPSRATRGGLAPSHAAGRADDGLDAPDADVHRLAGHGGVARLEHLLGPPAPAGAEEQVDELLHVLLCRLRLEAGLHRLGRVEREVEQLERAHLG